MLGYFVWKITILRQKIIFFPILGGARAGCAPPPPPLDPPLYTHNKKQHYFRYNSVTMDIKKPVRLTVSNNNVIARLVFIFKLQNFTQKVETYQSKLVKTDFSVWYNLNKLFLRRRLRYDFFNIKISLICTIRILNGRSLHGNSGIYVSQIWAQCDLKCGSDG
jgi:hypothetical protein